LKPNVWTLWTHSEMLSTFSCFALNSWKSNVCFSM
jgi:hypothetical protein